MTKREFNQQLKPFADRLKKVSNKIDSPEKEKAEIEYANKLAVLQDIFALTNGK